MAVPAVDSARDRARDLDPLRQAALVRLLAQCRARPATATGGTAAPIPPQPRDGRTFPCTPAQERIWLADQLAPDRVMVPNATLGLRLRGPLRTEAIERALRAVVERHESMRTVYVAAPPADNGADLRPRQRVRPVPAQAGAGVVPPEWFDVVDLTGLPAARRERRAEELATAAAERFDLTRGPLFRVTLFRLADHDHALLFVGVVKMTQGAGQFVVPIVAAGLMAAVGLRGILLIDVVSYLFAVVVTVLVKFPDTLPWRRREPFLSEVVGGWRYARGDAGLRPVLLFFAVLNLFMTPLFLLVSPLVLSFADLDAVARVSMATGLGGVVAGLLMSLWRGGPRTCRVRGPARRTCAGGGATVLSNRRAER